MFAWSSLAIPWWIHAFVGAAQAFVVVAPLGLAAFAAHRLARRGATVLLR